MTQEGKYSSNLFSKDSWRGLKILKKSFGVLKKSSLKSRSKFVRGFGEFKEFMRFENDLCEYFGIHLWRLSKCFEKA